MTVPNLIDTVHGVNVYHDPDLRVSLVPADADVEPYRTAVAIHEDEVTEFVARTTSDLRALHDATGASGISLVGEFALAVLLMNLRDGLG